GRYRASLAKTLPADAETAQLAIWGCTNFVDVWAGDVAAARSLAARQLPAKRGYVLGEFIEIQAPAEVAPQKAAA
ncbi:MAG: hypothetical protein JO128_21075, partial [Alphaproteobacteria bacterium]|nr:hypothetical protein [Alphaproteobacteria bacterium]